jgi:hypothetical protein
MADEQIAVLQVDVGFEADAPGSECLEKRYGACVVIVRVYWHQVRVVNESLVIPFPDSRVWMAASALSAEPIVDSVVGDAL